MGKNMLLQILQTAEDEPAAIMAIRQLERFLTDPEMVNLLCAYVVGTENLNIRQTLVATLKCRAEEAAARLVFFVKRSRNPIVRQRALASLAMMECRSASEAVLLGLMDSDRRVRMAAASNAGLYDDPPILRALEDFYEKHRLTLVMESLAQAAEAVSAKWRPPSEEMVLPLGLSENTI